MWMMSIAISVCLLVITAAAGAYDQAMAHANLLVAALVSIAMALLALRDTRQLLKGGASDMIVAGSLMRFMGLIWAWAALAISVTYGPGFLSWSSWWQYFIGFVLLSGLCLFVSRLLCEAEGPDEKLLKTAQYIGGATLFAMVTSIAVFGTNRLAAVPTLEADSWAATNVLLFGAIALAAVSSYLLKASVNEAR